MEQSEQCLSGRCYLDLSAMFADLQAGHGLQVLP